MPKTPISLYLSDDLIEALKSIAESDDRSLSWLVEKILREWLTSNGTK